MKTMTVPVGLLIVGLLAAPAEADAMTRAAREAAEYALRKFGKSAAKEGSEALASRIASAAARHGDDAILAVRRVGPRALRLADDAGEHAPQVYRLLARHGDDAATFIVERPSAMALFTRYGDDAAEALLKHKGIAEPVIGSAGPGAIRALGAVGPQAGRRMAMMADAGDLAAIGRTPELMAVVARHGDSAMDFIWRNKGALAVGVTLTAFLANPEPFIDGTTQLVDTAATSVVRPVVQETAKAASGLLRTLQLLLLGLAAGGVYVALRHPRAASGIGKAAIGVIRARSGL
ncbi:hypothetical protein AB1L88_16900 [Tautonia sp. JC769]|uniref:hypothetical protein n=1 Tax=Tautonia sp. JC769 TaxID=3232135 RepID=UPI00345AD8C3